MDIKKIVVLDLCDTVCLVCDTALFDIIVKIADLADGQRDVVGLADGSEAVLDNLNKFSLTLRERFQIRILRRSLADYQAFNQTADMQIQPDDRAAAEAALTFFLDPVENFLDVD